MAKFEVLIIQIVKKVGHKLNFVDEMENFVFFTSFQTLREDHSIYTKEYKPSKKTLTENPRFQLIYPY